jgi:hypothetical protein
VKIAVFFIQVYSVKMRSVIGFFLRNKVHLLLS